MNLSGKIQPRRLSGLRIFLALVVAIGTDGLQLLFNGVGWFGPDQALDCVAMVLTMWLLGFHILLLPTFAIKLIPLADDLPTWTACVIAVIALRKREEKLSPEPAQPPTPAGKPPIDI